MWLWEEGSPPPWESQWVRHYNLEFQHQQQGQLNCGKSLPLIWCSQRYKLGGNFRSTVGHLQIWSWRKWRALSSTSMTPFCHEVELDFPWIILSLFTHPSPLDWVDLPSSWDHSVSDWGTHLDSYSSPSSPKNCPIDDLMCIINECEQQISSDATCLCFSRSLLEALTCLILYQQWYFELSNF